MFAKLSTATTQANDRVCQSYEEDLFRAAMNSAEKGYAATSIFPEGKFQKDVCCRVAMKKRLEKQGFKVAVGKILDNQCIENYAKREYHGKIPKDIVYYLSIVWVGDNIMRLYDGSYSAK